MEEWIGLIDCNNFFVSCERLFRPDLRNKPVLVLSSNDGCVVARSKEIKDNHIPMGVPVFKIKDTLKDIGAVSFSSHFTLYRDVSRRVFEVVKRIFDEVEVYSIDESFFLIKAKDIKELEDRLLYLKDTVEREVGIPVSVGIAATKTLAKYANSVAKKTSGIFVLNHEDWLQRAVQVPLSDIWGVGYRLAETYKSHGLLTVTDLLALERRQVSALFGVVGVRLWLELQGIPSSSVNTKEHTQHSILHSRSFKNTTTDLLVIKDAVAYHIREASADLRQQGLKAAVLQVSLGTSRHDDWFLQGGSKERVFSSPTSDLFELLKVAGELVEEVYRRDVPYKKAGILLCGFRPEGVNQLELFENKAESKTALLTPLLDTLNAKLKGGEIIVGSYLKGAEWHASAIHRSPAYTTAWKDIATVKA